MNNIEPQNNPIKNLLLDALVKGESKMVGDLLDSCLDTGMSLQAVYVNLLSDLQCTINDMWTQGGATLAQEQRATQIMIEHLTRIRQSLRPRKPLSLKAVICALPGDHCFFGGRVVSDLLIMDGWEVDFLGAATPVEEILRHCQEVKADLLGLSLSDPKFIEEARVTMQKLKELMPNIKTIIGGKGVMNNEDAKKANADVVVTDRSQVVADARKVVGVGSSTNALFQTLGEIGGRIHHYRKSQKMSQEKLAAGSGLDRAYISSVENGKQNVTIGALLKLSDALGVDLSDLINAPIHQSN